MAGRLFGVRPMLSNDDIYEYFLQNPPVPEAGDEEAYEELDELLDEAEDLAYEDELFELAFPYSDDEFLKACGVKA